MTKPSPSSPKTIDQRVDDFIAKQNLASLFDEEKIKEIREGLVKHWGAVSDPEKLTISELNLEKIVGKIHRSKEGFDNVKRQELEIRKFELAQHPNFQHFLQQVKEVGNCNPLKSSEVPLDSWSASHQESVDWIKQNQQPIVHTQSPSKKYREAVLDAKTQALDDIRSSEVEFFTFVKQGRSATTQEIENSKNYSPTLSALSRSASSVSSPIMQMLNWAGRGTLTESKVANDERYSNYLETYKTLLNNIKYKLGTGKEINLQAIQKLQSLIEQNGGPLSKEQFAQIQQDISKEIAELEKIDKQELDSINKSMQDQHDKFAEQLSKDLKLEDSRFPLIAVQIALLVTPLAGLSLLPIAGNIVGPLFEAGSFGNSIGGAISNIPLIGDLAKLLKIDYALEWLLDNIPIVSDLGEVFGFVTNNEITQNAFQIASPSLSSEVLGLGLGALFFNHVLAPKLDQAKQSADGEKTLRENFSNIEEGLINQSQNHRKASIDRIEKKTEEALKKTKEAKIQVISSVDEKKSEIFGISEILDQNNRKSSFADLYKADKTNAVKLLNDEKNKAALDEIYVKSSAFSQLGGDVEKFLKKSTSEIQLLSEAREKGLREKVIESSALKYPTHSKDDLELLKHAKEQREIKKKLVEEHQQKKQQAWENHKSNISKEKESAENYAEELTIANKISPLATDTKTTSLDLSNSNIGAKALSALAAIISSKDCHLKQINLAENPRINDQNIGELFTAISNPDSRVTKINFGNVSNVSAEVREKFSKQLEENKSKTPRSRPSSPSGSKFSKVNFSSIGLFS